MSKLITIFNGSSVDIPDGWDLCNGSNGTPNLLNKFVTGASTTGEVGNSGGATSHSHSIESAGSHSHSSDEAGAHTHPNQVTTSNMLIYFKKSDSGLSSESHSHVSGSGGSHNHTSGTSSNLPTYYNLCYIATDMVTWDFPIGSIVMWSGSVENIPEGWAFCNGSNGTIDLRNRFIRGARGKGSTGGSTTHSHTTSSDGGHTHIMDSAQQYHDHRVGASGGWLDFIERTSATKAQSPNHEYNNHNHTVNGAGTHSHSVIAAVCEPPFYKLAFIQRIL